MLKEGQIKVLMDRVQYDQEAGKWIVPPFQVRDKQVSMPKIKHAKTLVRKELDQHEVVLDGGEVLSSASNLSEEPEQVIASSRIKPNKASVAHAQQRKTVSIGRIRANKFGGGNTRGSTLELGGSSFKNDNMGSSRFLRQESSSSDGGQNRFKNNSRHHFESLPSQNSIQSINSNERRSSLFNQNIDRSDILDDQISPPRFKKKSMVLQPLS